MNRPQFIRPFGPTIYSNTISDLIFKLLSDKCSVADTQGTNVGNMLAGFVEKQLRIKLSDEEHELFVDHIAEHLTMYLGGSLADIKRLYRLSKDSLWVNIQGPGEFNPVHNHTGTFSGVIYIDVPVEIKNERVESTSSTTFRNFGEIFFSYGTLGETFFYMLPQNQQIILFPAGLHHGVHPFYSNVHRISVAFNLFEDGQYWDRFYNNDK